MEIKRYLEEYKKHPPEEFFNWLSKGKPLEVRFLSDYKGDKFNNWGLIRKLAEILKVEYRFSSLYIQTWDQLHTILRYKVYDKYTATRYYNIFIGVNPKRKVPVKGKNGLIYNSYYGGIAGISHLQTFLCDIEHSGLRTSNATEAMLEECVLGAKFLVKQLKLKSFYINISGNGVHLWAEIEPIELPLPTFIEYDDKLKYNLKEDPIYSFIKTYNGFISSLNRTLQKYNPKLIVDEGAKDISRIARPPSSINNKAGLTPRYIGTVYKELSNIKYNYNKYVTVNQNLNKQEKKQLKRTEKSRFHRYNHLNIRESPLYKLLVSEFLPSIVSRNHYLEQSFARLLKDNEIKLSEITEVIREIDAVQRKAIQVDPDYLYGDEPFNSEMVNSYCIASKIPLIYDLLEEIPTITKEYMAEARYLNLNEFTLTTASRYAIPNVKMPNNYIELKNLIRNLIDKNNPRSEIFFTLKILLLKDWDYYHEQRIILKLLNKTRRQN